MADDCESSQEDRENEPLVGISEPTTSVGEADQPKSSTEPPKLPIATAPAAAVVVAAVGAVAPVAPKKPPLRSELASAVGSAPATVPKPPSTKADRATDRV